MTDRIEAIHARHAVIVQVLAEHSRADWSDRTYACGGCRARAEDEPVPDNETPDELRARWTRLQNLIHPRWSFADYNAHVAEHILAALAPVAPDAEHICERACQYAMDVGVPEYSGITNGRCGNCDHYAPDAEHGPPDDLPTEDDAPVITLCGSTKFKAEFAEANQRLSMAGNVVISLGVFGHTDLPDYDWTTDATDLKSTLDRLHFQKIRMADEVYVIDVGGYVGESTRREIAYAESLGKPVRYLSAEHGEPTEWEWSLNDTVQVGGHVWSRVSDFDGYPWRSTRGSDQRDQDITELVTKHGGRVLVCKARGIGVELQRLTSACKCGDCYHPVIGPNTDGEPCDFCRDCACPSANHTRMTHTDTP